MADIDIRVKASAEGLSTLDDAAGKVKNLGDAATDAGGDSASTGMSWLTVAAGNFVAGAVTGMIEKLPEIIGNLYEVGDAANTAADNFKAFGGKEDQIAAMRDASKGLVDNFTLMKSATTVLKDDLTTSKDELIKIAEQGAVLGKQFEGDATKGVRDFSKALTEIGTYTTLRDLGIDADKVRDKFNELKKIMTDEDAWKMAVFEESQKVVAKMPGALDDTGGALERLKTNIANFISGAGQSFVNWLNGIISGIEKAATDLPGLVTQAAADDHKVLNDLIDDKAERERQQAAQYYYDVTHPQVPAPAGPPKPPPHEYYGGGMGTRESQYGGYGGYGDYYHEPDAGGGATPPSKPAATIEAPKVTRAEFDAIVAGANQATAATALFGVTAAAAMTSLSLSGLLAAGSLGLVASQAGSAVTQVRQLQTDLKALISLSINITASKQTGSTGGGDTTPARGPR